MRLPALDLTIAGPCLTYYLLMGCGAHWCVAQTTRSQLRSKYNLAEEPCNDCLTHCCCSALAVWYVACGVSRPCPVRAVPRSAMFGGALRPCGARIGAIDVSPLADTIIFAQPICARSQEARELKHRGA